MNETRDFNRIPATACTLTIGEFELGDNGEGAKTAPVRLVARTGKAIEHWFWGRVVHDMAGMHLHKPRLPIDYVHDSKEVMGYLNKFDSTTGDLVTSGALVPFKESDRATEVIHKMRAGVPYEASINFGGDGIKVEEVPEGRSVQVNGAMFAGPGLIVREWPLRGVAICPYGADANTESSALAGNNAKTFAATLIAAPQAKTEGTVMTEKKPVEVVAPAATPAADEQKKVDSKPAEQLAKAETPAPETVAPAPVVEVAPVAVEALSAPAPQKQSPVPVAPVVTLSREDFVKIANEFGDGIAAKVMREGGDYNTAMRFAYEAAKEEANKLRKEVAELGAATGVPVKVVPAPVDGKDKSKLFNTGKK